MKVKVSELSGAALDWAAGYCDDTLLDSTLYAYSTNWAWGGPIIEREKVALSAAPEHWSAYVARGTREIAGNTTLNWTFKQNGPTPPDRSHALLCGKQVGR